MTGIIYKIAGYCTGVNKLKKIGLDENSVVYERLMIARQLRQCELAAELLHAWIYMQVVGSLFVLALSFYKIFYYGNLPDSVIIEPDAYIGKIVAAEMFILASVALFIEAITKKTKDLHNLRHEVYLLKLSLRRK